MVSLRAIVLNLLRIRSLPKGQVQIGQHTSGIPYVMSYLENDRVAIGKFCSIAADVMLIPTVGHIPARDYQTYRVSTYPLARVKKNGWRQSYLLPGKPGSIIVGNDVWIGARAIILCDVKIGDGAIVGAGSVVTCDVPPYAVVAGVPAKVLRFRYSEEQRKKLLEIGWWDWPLEKIAENMDYFYGRVDSFIRKFWKEESRATSRHTFTC